MSEQTAPIAGPMAAHSTAAATPEAEIMDHQTGPASTEGADSMEIDRPPAVGQVSGTGGQKAPAQQPPREEESTPDAAQVRRLGDQSASASQSGGETAPSPAESSQPGGQGLPPVAQTSERGIGNGTAPGQGSQAGGQNLPPAAQNSQPGRQNATDAAVQPGVQTLPPGAQNSQPGGQTATEAVRAVPRPRGRPPGSKVEVCLQCTKLKFWVCPDCCKCQEKLFKNGKWGGGKWCQVCTNRRRERNKAVAEGKFPYPQRTCDCTPRRRCDYHLDHMCGECADQGNPQACPKHCKCGADGQKCDACLLKQDIRFRTNKEKVGCGCMSECPLCISCTCKKMDALCGFCKGGFDKGFLGDKLDPLRKMKPLPVPQNAIPATVDAPSEVRVYFPSFQRLFFLVSKDVVRGESVHFRGPSGDPFCPTIPTNQEIDILYHYFPDIRCEQHRSLIFILGNSDGSQLAPGTYIVTSTRRQTFVTAPTRIRLWPFEVIGDTGWQTVVLPEHLSFEKWLEGEEERNGLTFNCRYKGQKVVGDAGGSAAIQKPLSSLGGLRHQERSKELFVCSGAATSAPESPSPTPVSTATPIPTITPVYTVTPISTVTPVSTAASASTVAPASTITAVGAGKQTQKERWECSHNGQPRKMSKKQKTHGSRSFKSGCQCKIIRQEQQVTPQKVEQVIRYFAHHNHPIPPPPKPVQYLGRKKKQVSEEANEAPSGSIDAGSD